MFLDKKYLYHLVYKNCLGINVLIQNMKYNKKNNKDFIDLISKDEKYKYLINDNKKIDIKKINEKEHRYRYIFEFKNGCNTHPHNIYLEYLSELGFLDLYY